MPAMELQLSPMSSVQSNVRDESNSDARLLRRYFKDGDREAMNELFKRHAGTAYRLAFADVENAADAEEIVQTAFLKVLLNEAKETDNVRGWIMRIVVNTCHDKMKEEARRRSRQKAVAVDLATTEAPDDERSELASAAVSAVKTLPKSYRLPVWLHYLEGLSFDEVGCALSLPEATVRSQANRGIEQVRQLLDAAGFTASMVAIPELLTSSTLPNAPAALTASFKTMIAGAKGSSAATGAAAVTTKGAVAATTSKVAITAALLVLSAAIVATAVHLGGGNETRQGADIPPAAPAAAPTLVAAQNIDNSLAEILNKKIDVNYRRDYLSEVLDDLDKRVGLRSAFAKPIDKTFMFTLEEKQVTVKQVLEKLAVEGKLDLEYHGDTTVFWKRADDQALTNLQKKLRDGNVEERCEAVYDLTRLGDKRVYRLLSAALEDNDEAVVVRAISGLRKHEATLKYGTAVQAVVDSTLKLIAAPRNAAEKSELILLLGETRDARAVELLAPHLKDADADVRGYAVSALSETHDPRAIDLLIPLTKDADKRTRENAVMCLGNTGDPKAVESLIALSKDALSDLQYLAIGGLGQMRDPKAIEALMALLKDADVMVRQCAASALGRNTPDPRTVEPLIALLQDDEEQIRWFAADALGRIAPEPRIVEALIALSNGASSDMRYAAAVGLSEIRDPRAIEALIALLKDADGKVRSDAASDLGSTRDPGAVEPLISLLKDTDATVRSAAVLGLFVTRDARATDLFIALLKDADENLRSAAASSGMNLDFTRDAKVADLFIALLKGADAKKRYYAASVLTKTLNPTNMPYYVAPDSAKTMDPRIVQPLISLLKDADAKMRSAVATALSNVLDPRAVEPLISLLKDADAEVRFVAARGLGSSHDPRALDALITLTKVGGGNERCSAAKGLGYSRDSRAIDTLIALTKDADDNVRSSAAEGLGVRRDPRAKAALAEYEKSNPPPVKPPAPPSSDF